MDAFHETNAGVLTSFTSAVRDLGEDAFRHLAEDTVALARGNTMHGRPGLIPRTGKFARSIHADFERPYRPGGVGEATVGSPAPQARIQELGGTVRPVRAKLLRFRLWRPTDRLRPTGKLIFAKKATLPARPYLNPAAKTAQKEWPRFAENALKRAKRARGWQT